MKILSISDIHCNLKKLKPIAYKYADILIIAGDLTNIGSRFELRNVLDKINSFKHIKYRIIVLGNHDARNIYIIVTAYLRKMFMIGVEKCIQI